ncbi:hypothetical protein D3C76_1415680 [compost metagenome]
MNSFIRERSTSGNHTNVARHMNITRHDADFAFTWCNNARTVRPDQNGIFAFHETVNLDHIKYRDTFGNTDHEIQLCVNSFHDGIRCKRRRNVDDARCCASSFLRFLHRVEYWQADD